MYEKLKIQCRYILKEESLLSIYTHLLFGSCALKYIKVYFTHIQFAYHIKCSPVEIVKH